MEPGDGAVRGEETGGQVLGRAAHDGHLGADVELADVARAVGLAQDAVDVRGEVMELEGQVEVTTTKQQLIASRDTSTSKYKQTNT